MPTLLAVTVDGKTGFGTSSATTDCQAGAVIAEPTVTTKLNSSKLAGAIRFSHTSAANATETTVIVDSQTIKKTPLIHNIRERTRRNCKQKHRQAVGDDRRDPNYGERPMTNRTPHRGD
jgi:hypothetical protein